MEFADEVVGHLDLDSMLTADDSLGTAIDELRRVFTTLSGNAV